MIKSEVIKILQEALQPWRASLVFLSPLSWSCPNTCIVTWNKDRTEYSSGTDWKAITDETKKQKPEQNGYWNKMLRNFIKTWHKRTTKHVTFVPELQPWTLKSKLILKLSPRIATMNTKIKINLDSNKDQASQDQIVVNNEVSERNALTTCRTPELRIMHWQNRSEWCRMRQKNPSQWYFGMVYVLPTKSRWRRSCWFRWQQSSLARLKWIEKKNGKAAYARKRGKILKEFASKNSWTKRRDLLMIPLAHPPLSHFLFVPRAM